MYKNGRLFTKETVQEESEERVTIYKCVSVIVSGAV